MTNLRMTDTSSGQAGRGRSMLTQYNVIVFRLEESIDLKKTDCSFETTPSFVRALFSFSLSLWKKNNHSSLILSFSVSLSLSLRLALIRIYLFNQALSLLLLSQTDQVCEDKTKIVSIQIKTKSLKTSEKETLFHGRMRAKETKVKKLIRIESSPRVVLENLDTWNYAMTTAFLIIVVRLIHSTSSAYK